MAEYIDREEALSFPFANGKFDHENANEHFIYGCESYKEWLENLPAVDAVPAVHGEWIEETEDIFTGLSAKMRCSKCLAVNFVCPEQSKNFCPNCGADMRGKLN